MARFWYVYNSVGDPVLPGSYILLTSNKPACQNGGRMCAIYSPSGGNSPSVISVNIRNYIANGLITLIAQPGTTPGIKKYVYMKS